MPKHLLHLIGNFDQSASLVFWFYYLFIIIDLTCMEKVSVMIRCPSCGGKK